MKALSIPDLECQYYDYSQAAAFFKEIGCKNAPQLGVLEYHSDTKSCCTIGWCSQEGDFYQDLPVFKSFKDTDEYDSVIFVPMHEDEVFIVDEHLYLTVSVNGKLGIRRVNFLFNESIAQALNAIRGIPEMEYELCKIYQDNKQHQFLGYHWVSKSNSNDNEFSQLVIAPAFNGDENIFNTKNITELEITVMEKGEIFVMHNTMWQVGFSEQHGITINHIADVHGTPC